MMSQNNSTDEIEIHIRTYRSLLKSAGEIKISQLIDSHLQANPLLHEKGKSKTIDIAAFIYVLLRLPACMSNVKNIILGQSYDVFKKNGFGEIKNWQEVESPGRRRKIYFDGKETLAVYIASVTDVDDIITLTTAFQIEWNKFHQNLKNSKDVENTAKKFVSHPDLERVRNIWGIDYHKFLTAIRYKKMDFRIKLLSGSYMEYAKATRGWWSDINNRVPITIRDKHIYFVSSNTHSLTNLLTRFVLTEEKTLIEYLYQSKNEDLIRLWEEIGSGDFLAGKENFLYYLAKKYARANPAFHEKRKALEKKYGIHHIRASNFLDIDVQVIEINKLAGLKLEERLNLSTNNLHRSNSLIVNIDYPLGWAAYQVLTEIGQTVTNIRGVYIMGKAATLNGQIGDILIPNTVFDQHTKNTYIFNNCFKASDFSQIFKTGMILDHQKTFCAKGTFLQNRKQIEKWYTDGSTIIEMESGPYLNAMYEFVYYNRYFESQLVNLVNSSFDIGIVHYASDTPYSKAKNLGVRNLSYEGVEPTYAISGQIIKRIVDKENSNL